MAQSHHWNDEPTKAHGALPRDAVIRADASPRGPPVVAHVKAGHRHTPAAAAAPRCLADRGSRPYDAVNVVGKIAAAVRLVR
jgi:hypothetical protein